MADRRERLRWGILGTGNIAGQFSAGVRASARGRLAAVASRSADAAAAFASAQQVDRAYGSYAQLLTDDAVDAVYVSLPNALHVEWSVRALEAGKHVLCEKPLSRDPAAVERAFDAADAAGRTLMEGFMWRHAPQTRRLLELLPEIGALRVIRAHFSFPQPAAGNVRLSAQLEGGALMDVGCYCVSAARLLAGAEPEAVAGVATGGDVDLAFAGVLRFPGGVLAHFDCGMDTAHRHELEVVGTEGTLVVRDPWHCRDVGIERDGERIDVEFRDPYLCEIEQFGSFGRADALGQARVLADLHRAAA